MAKSVWAALGTAQWAGDERSVQACIERALTYLSEDDQKRFQKKFHDQAGDEHQVMHTFRELLTGVFIVRQGFTPRYEPEIVGLTPDWHFRREGDGEFIADVVNFHIDKKVEAEQDEILARPGLQVWCDWMPDNSHRLYQSIRDKAGKHKEMALKEKMPFVVVVYSWFSAALQPHEVEVCLLPEDMLFKEYPTLTGVYHMDQRGNCLVEMLPFLLCVISPCSFSVAADDGVALPRYRLEVGQELVYQRTADDDPQEANDANNEKGKAARSEMEWRTFVVRQNDDGSWRLYIRTKIKIVNRDGVVRRRWDSLGYCDLHPGGSYSMDEQTAIFKRLLPYEYFCRLPDTSAALVDGWQYAPPVDGKVFTYRLAQRGRAHLQIVGILHDAYSEAAKRQITKTYDFDTQRGIIVRVAEESKDLAADQMAFPEVGASTLGLLSSPGAQGCLLTASALYAGRTAFNRRNIIRLTSSARRDPAWVARFDEEAQRYLDVHTKWMALCYEGVRARSVEACRTARVKARRLLVAGREHAQLELFRELYDATINSHDDDEKGHELAVKEREELFAAVPGFPTTWEAKNLDGSLFRLADQRGKVLVLYFWTTGCEYNVLAAPQICQLSADYQGKRDVAIVGMFIRSKIADEEIQARYLIVKCLQGFPHLEANEIAALYRFQKNRLGCPTTMVLDQSGRVHEVQVGYSGDLAQYIRKIVDDLRSKAPAKRD